MSLRISTIIARRKKYEADHGSVPLNPTPGNCLYCGAKATCGEMHKLALKIAPNYDDTFQLPDEYHPSQITDPNQMAKARAVAEVMDKWAKSVKEHANQMVLNGQEIPGWELKSRTGRTEIKDAQAAFVVAKSVVDISLEEFVSIVSVNKTDYEKLIGSKAPKGQKTKLLQKVSDELIASGVSVRAADIHYLGRIRE